MSKMGIGTFLPQKAVLKKQYRYTMQFDKTEWADAIPPISVMRSQRPTLNVEKNELFFMNERAFVAAKGSWDPISVTFYDFATAGTDGSHTRIINWIKACYWFDEPAQSGLMGEAGGVYKRNGALSMYDAMGRVLEQWTLYGCFIESYNPGDLSYDSSDLATIECTISLDQANLVFQAYGGDTRPNASGDASNNSFA